MQIDVLAEGEVESCFAVEAGASESLNAPLEHEGLGLVVDVEIAFED